MTDWSLLWLIFMDENIIVRLEKDKVVTATFRKLDSAKKTNIYRSSLKLFGENIFESVLLENIARKAEISKGSLIQYFGYKENLLLFLTEMVASDYQTYFDNYFINETVIRTKDRIEQFFIAHKKFKKNNRAEFDFILMMLFENSNKLSNQFVKTIFEVQKRYLENIVKRGIETNQIRRDIRSLYLASVLHSILIGLLRELFLDGPVSPKDDFDQNLSQYLNIIFDGIK